MKRHGLLDLAVLGLLKEQSMHGYQLRRQLGAKLGPFWQVSWGSLYPTLRRLARSGTVRKIPQKKSSGGGPGHTKTVYGITPQGEELFSELLEEPAAQPDNEHFALKLAFFQYLKPEARVMLLERRRAYLLEKLVQFKENLRLSKGRIDSYSRSLQNHGMAVVEEDIEWIDGLISHEKRGASRVGETIPEGEEQPQEAPASHRNSAAGNTGG